MAKRTKKKPGRITIKRVTWSEAEIKSMLKPQLQEAIITLQHVHATHLDGKEQAADTLKQLRKEKQQVIRERNHANNQATTLNTRNKELTVERDGLKRDNIKQTIKAGNLAERVKELENAKANIKQTPLTEAYVCYVKGRDDVHMEGILINHVEANTWLDAYRSPHRLFKKVPICLVDGTGTLHYKSKLPPFTKSVTDDAAGVSISELENIRQRCKHMVQGVETRSINIKDHLTDCIKYIDEQLGYRDPELMTPAEKMLEIKTTCKEAGGIDKLTTAQCDRIESLVTN